LLAWIELTTSVVVKPQAFSRFGSTLTSSAGVTVPLAETLEIPYTCSSAGMISLVTTPESCGRLSEREVTASVTTVICAGSKVRTVGAGRSCGKAALAV